MKRRTFLMGLPLAGLMGCGAEAVWAPQDEVAAVAYRGTGPKSLTLYTMKNVASDNGAHSGLLIDASERVLFDPAGTFGHPSIPERNDVLYGFSPEVEAYYASYHARESFYVISQKVQVPADVAERALMLARAAGPVPKAFCARATSSLLAQLPGFDSIGTTFMPNNLADDVAQLPGVQTRVYRETDSDDKSIAAAEIDAAIQAGQ